MVDNQYKLILKPTKKGTGRELYDIRKDPAETKNLAVTEPEITKLMEQTLKTWQYSVLNSLTGADYWYRLIGMKAENLMLTYHRSYSTRGDETAIEETNTPSR